MPCRQYGSSTDHFNGNNDASSPVQKCPRTSTGHPWDTQGRGTDIRGHAPTRAKPKPHQGTNRPTLPNAPPPVANRYHASPAKTPSDEAGQNAAAPAEDHQGQQGRRGDTAAHSASKARQHRHRTAPPQTRSQWPRKQQGDNPQGDMPQRGEKKEKTAPRQAQRGRSSK